MITQVCVIYVNNMKKSNLKRFITKELKILKEQRSNTVRPKGSILTRYKLYQQLGYPKSVGQLVEAYKSWYPRILPNVISGELATPEALEAELANKGVGMDEPIRGANDKKFVLIAIIIILVVVAVLAFL